MQQMIPNRIVIYAKDIMNITGRRERAARKMLAKIRKKYKKKKGEFISIDEFCEFTSLKKESVTEFLSN
jgi:archaellum biogenesis ATPase FlaH